jgi:hypothetical protein
VGEAPIHLKLFADRRKAFGKFSQIKIELHGIELNSSQKKIRLFVSVLVSEQDIAAVAKDEVGNAGDHALVVGAGNKQDGGGMHVDSVAL